MAVQRYPYVAPNRKLHPLTIARLVLRFFLAAALATTLITPAAAQNVRKSDIVKVLERLHELPGVIEGYKRDGFDDERIVIVLSHTRLMMANKGVSGYVADQLIAASLGEPTVAHFGGVVQPLIDSGLPYLPLKEQLYYLSVERTLASALSVENCGRMMKKTLKPETFSRENNNALSRLNIPALREYFRILRKAAATGVSRKTPPRISDRTRERALAQYFSDVTARATAQRLIPQLEESSDSIRVLSNADACRLGLIFVDAALEYKGSDKKTLIQLYLLGFE